MAVKKSAKTNQPRLRFTVRHALTDIYVVLMFTFFPLFLSKYYSAARRDKFWSFLIITTVIGISVGIISLANYLTRNSTYNKKLNTYKDPFTLNITDYAFFAFAGISLISTFTSGHIGHCLVGMSSGTSNGRNMGLITILLLLVAYLVISRFYFDKKMIYYCIFGGISIVILIAIANYYYIDVLGIFKAYEGSSSYDTVTKDFTSTIGNKNYLSALICVSLPFSFGMSIATEDKIMRIVAYVSTAIQFMGLIVATSDSGFLGCFAAFAVMAVVVSRSKTKLMRYCAGITVMMISAKLLQLFDLIMKGNSKGYYSFSQFFLSSSYVFVIMTVFAAVTVLLYLTTKNSDNSSDDLPKGVFFALLSVVCLAATAFMGLVIYFTFIDKETALTGTMKFFRFNIYWGTHRGYFWIKSLEVYKNMNLWQKLFGAGPETFYFMFQPYFSEMAELFNEGSNNSAHNVYINYLITHGALGLASYLLLIGSSIMNGIKNSKTNPLSLICAFVIIAYAAQDFVNIANPVNTSWFFIFIALNESTRLRANSPAELASHNF